MQLQNHRISDLNVSELKSNIAQIVVFNSVKFSSAFCLVLPFMVTERFIKRLNLLLQAIMVFLVLQKRI